MHRRRRAPASRRDASRSSTSTAATSRSPTRTARRRRPERRDLQLPRAAARARARRAPVRARAATPRCSSTATRSGASRFAERLRGMFAVAIWDARARRLVLARDRFGIKPLYYRDVGGELSFASELDALPQGEVDLDALEAFLAFNSIPAPLSIFRDDPQAAAGPHARPGRTARVALERFARPGPLPARHDDDEAELVEECRARLRDSVRAHLVADVPVGVLLSGGVDSGALAALAARGVLRAGAHVLDRLRGGLLRRAGRRARGRAALRDAPPRAVAPARRGAAAARARGRVRRAVRRLVGAADVPRLEARGRGREGRALGRGRRRALRRLLHLRRRPARRALRRRSRRSRGRSSSGCRRRRAGRASTTRRSASRAPRTCRRSSATTAGRRSSPPTRAPS